MSAIEYDTVALEPYDEDAEYKLLQERGCGGWKLACVSIFNRKPTGEFSSKYYFVRQVEHF